jgi:hypothetical protein
VDDRESYLPFTAFPWFANATVAQLSNVERPVSHHLYWPDLDIDLHSGSIESPESFPLLSRSTVPERR